MAEPFQKRQKTEEDADFKQINDFLQKDKNRSYLKMILDQINFGVGNTSVYFVQVRGANASVNSKFSTATIDADFIKKGQDQMLFVPLALFFGRGFGILSSLVNKDEVPEDMDERRALLGLIKFLERTAEQSVLLDRDKNLQQH
ncbi:uncharacterized protein LOC128549286 [Mercenaria mercenaria]|uniref:uncharacterized protein LOC128549286 n=1 Tax=Mercenaria mercenaria TaxID=6596 RepID=UPI00234FA586|nr:uncharacterized protein LOC128549286 [Mercenaria mercenaria]